MNNYNVTIVDAHAHTTTLTVPATSPADALVRSMTEALFKQTTQAGHVATDTWTVTVAIA